MKTTDILDRLKEHFELKTDYQLAKRMEIGHSTMSNWRVGRSEMDVATAIKAAEILGDDPIRLVAAVELQRAKGDRQKNVLKRYAGFAQTPIFIVLFALAVAAFAAPAIAHIDSQFYTLCELMRRRLRYAFGSNKTNKELLPWIVTFAHRARFAAGRMWCYPPSWTRRPARLPAAV